MFPKYLGNETESKKMSSDLKQSARNALSNSTASSKYGHFKGVLLEILFGLACFDLGSFGVILGSNNRVLKISSNHEIIRESRGA